MKLKTGKMMEEWMKERSERKEMENENENEKKTEMVQL